MASIDINEKEHKKDKSILFKGNKQLFCYYCTNKYYTRTRLWISSVDLQGCQINKVYLRISTQQELDQFSLHALNQIAKWQ